VNPLFQPPPTDRELDEPLVRLTLGQQFPELELRRVQFLGAGWEYDVYLIDDHLVIRFPRYAEVAQGLERAEKILSFVAGELPLGLRVPRIVLRGKPGPYFPHPFLGHELIPGNPASDSAVPLSPELAHDLGSALSLIHGISPDRASRLGLPPQKWDCRSSFHALGSVYADVPDVESLVPDSGNWIRSLPEVPPEYSGPVRFIHDDFQPEHIIVDNETGRLSGIIDWGPALGDPAQDFSFISATWGWDFTSRVMDAYQGAVDPGFLPRLLFLGRVRALGWLVYEVRMGLDTAGTEAVVRDLLSVGML